MHLEELIPAGAERGAGLILEYGERYLFFLAGSRYRAGGPTFFAGIGGHLEGEETWTECVQREAVEEIGTEVKLVDSGPFYCILADDWVVRMDLTDPLNSIRPVALLEILIPPDAPWNKAGETYPYFVAVYRSKLGEKQLPAPVDVDGLILLPAGLILESLQETFTLADLLSRGAELVEKEHTPRDTIVYPFGSARAMALLMRAGEHFF